MSRKIKAGPTLQQLAAKTSATQSRDRFGASKHSIQVVAEASEGKRIEL